MRSYLLCSTAFHAGIIAFGLLSSCHATIPAVPLSTVSLVNVDVEGPAPERSTKPPGGGSPAGAKDREDGADKVVVHVAPAKAKEIKRAKSLENAPLLEVKEEPTRSPTPASETSERDVEAAQAATDRQHDALMAAAAAAAAAAAYGTGPGSHGGPGGSGAGWGPPAIRGNVAFGNGSHGAFTGRVCFFPFGTMRIVDIHDCEYVATVYTDTFNIPERHYRDGFPGVTGRSEWFLIDYTGTFTVSEYGSYEFRLYSDDGSYLYIDDKLVINNDGKHAPFSKHGSIPLFVGEHEIRVRYAQTDDRMALQLFVTGPTGDERLFTPKL